MHSFALKRTSNQPPILPYEIWLRIASYVHNDLPGLIDVHRAFFDMAMRSMYREVLIYHEREESTNRCLKVMGPTAASFVQKLVLRPHIFGLHMPSKAVDQTSNQRSVSKGGLANARRKLSWGSSKSENIRILMNRIREMTQLTSVVVGCYFDDSMPYFLNAMPFLDSAWSHSPRLHELALHLPILCLDNVLATMPHFPVLEKLDLSIWSHGPDPLDCEATLTTVATFINRHSSSLTRLTIDIPTANFDSSPLFLGIEQLPKLVGVGTEQPLQRLEPQEEGPISNFFDKHRATLQELRLQLYETTVADARPTPSSFFSNSIFQLDFPSISFLDLSLCYWDKRSESSLASSLAQYLSKFRHTLTRLTLRGCILSLPIIESFVLALGDDTILRELEMHVHYLSTDLLDLLVFKLPRLRSLDLTYSWLQYKDDGRWDPDLQASYFPFESLTISRSASREFFEKIQGRVYSSWPLRRLQVCPRGIHAAHCGDVRKIMAVCLPNVHTINGIPRSYFEDSQILPTTPLYFLPIPTSRDDWNTHL